MVDLRMPEIDGLGVLQAIRDIAPDCRTILMTGFATEETKLEAVKLGALDYLPKPLDLPYLEQRFKSIREDIERRRAISGAVSELAHRLEFAAGLVGRSAVMNDMFELIRRLAPYARVALITGETGVGKELVARAMWELGPRRDRRFIPINCSAVVESLFESELFGYVRGAFTGANTHKVGLLEQAGGGTVFLDEVGELPLAMQAKLLRVLDSGEVYPVGSTEPRKLDVIMLAATNRDLEAEAATGRFRADLFYRLNVAEIHVPPLRDRRQDIPYLTATFLQECRERLKKPLLGVTPSAERWLLAADWPGNVRQLRNLIDRASMLCDGAYISDRELRSGLSPKAQAAGLQPTTGGSGAPAVPEPFNDAPERDLTLRAAKRDHVREVLERFHGDRDAAAESLGVSRRTLNRLIHNN